MELNQEKIEALIVTEAAERIISDDTIYDRVKRDIDARVNNLFASRVEAQITATIDDAIRSGFDRPYQKHDGFGKPVGEPTTLGQQLEKRIDSYWNARVDSQGKPTDSTYSTTSTRAEWVMAKICAEDFQKEMKQHAINATGQLKDGLRRELQETVNRMLAELFHVRSADDQGKERRDSSIIHPATKATT